MIAREWRCRCPKVHRDGFLKHLGATGVSECTALPGFRGYQVLEREQGGEVEITLMTFWRSLADVSAFAGEDIGQARLYPGDEAFGITPETQVRHYSLLAQGFPRG